MSESKIPELFKDDVRKAREGPSPGTYADGLLKTSLSPTGGALSRARLKRYAAAMVTWISFAWIPLRSA